MVRDTSRDTLLRRKIGRLCPLELGESARSVFVADGSESHDELLVVFEIFDADHDARAELCMVHAAAGTQAWGLILFLIAEVLRRDLRVRILSRCDVRNHAGRMDSAISPVGFRCCSGRRLGPILFDQIRGNLVDESRRLGAWYSPNTRRRAALVNTSRFRARVMPT